MKTNAANQEKELRATAWRLTKATYGRAFPVAIMLFSVLVLALLPGLYSVGFLFLSIPLLLLPAVFTAQMKMKGVSKREAPDYKETFGMFISYFVAPWRGVYRAIKTLLIAALIWVVASSISGVLYLSLASNFDPEFVAAYDAFQMEAQNAASYYEVMEMMSEFVYSPVAASFEKATMGFGAGLAGYYFLHSIGVSSIVAEFHFLFDGKAQFLDNRIFYSTYRSIRPTLAATYWKYFFFMPILYVVGFVSSFLIGASYVENPAVLPIIGFAGAGVLMMFAIPYFYNLMSSLIILYEIPASEIIVGQGKATIETMSHTPDFPKEVLEQTKTTVGVLEETLAAKKNADEAKRKEETKKDGSSAE